MNNHSSKEPQTPVNANENTEIIDIISHQLRSPLAAIRHVHQTLLDNDEGNLTDQQLYLLRQAELRAKHIVSILDDLLHSEALNDTELRMNYVSGYVKTMLREVLEQLEMEYTNKHISIETDFDDAEAALLFDRVKLMAAFMNLVGNAINYTNEGGTVTLRTEYQSDAVTITVQDTGVGVNPEDIPKLFQKFVRLGSAPNTNPRGMGIGLYITKKIVEKHNGQLVYSPNKPQGSVFTVTLPLQ